ncbi:MAG TPA: hypothetical protein VFQ45_14195 [Longimicrobium sp.]|nr:hypothetical protein [Longimicrobium sp.]
MDGLLPPFGTLAGEAVRAALVSALLLLLFGAAEVWRRWGNPPVEWTRKLVHFGGGVVAGAFPWLFRWHWTVLALGIAFGLIIWGTRRLGLLSSVHGVERRSQGGIYYPIAIYLLFLLGAGQPVFYLVSLLVLMVADTLAALLGSEYGRRIYSVESDRRSLEGSAAFLLTTFLAVHLPQLLLTQTGRAESVLIAAQIAIVVTILEGISLEGSDNLVVPLATYFLLESMTPHPAPFVARQLVVLVLVAVLVGLLAWRFRFVALSSAMGLALVVYGAYALGGSEWVLAPALAVLCFAAFDWLVRRVEPEAVAGYHIRGLFYVAILPLLLLFANNVIERESTSMMRGLTSDALYVPYVAVIAAHLVTIVFGHGRRVETERRRTFLGMSTAAALFGWVLVVGVGLGAGTRGITAWGMLIAVGVSAVTLALYLTIRRLPAWPRVPPWDVRLQMLSATVAMLLLVPLHLWLLMARW